MIFDIFSNNKDTPSVRKIAREYGGSQHFYFRLNLNNEKLSVIPHGGRTEAG